MTRALNRLCKWRLVLTGRQLGTRPDTDPEAIAVRDIQERLLILRAEVSALAGLMIDEGLPRNRLLNRIADEADRLAEAYQHRFPGFVATDTGITMDPRAVETMRGWKP